MPGEFARDGDRDDRSSLTASFERVPAGVETACALVGARADRSWLALAASLERRARTEVAALMPGRLDKQPAGVRVAGLGDRAEAALLAA